MNSTGLDTGAILSNDEQFIYFISNRSGFAEIWRYDLNKKIETPVTHLKTPLIEYLSLSHNGQRIAAVYMDKSDLVTGIFSTFTGELIAQKPERLTPLNWSLDDKSIYLAKIKNNEKKLLKMNSQTMEISQIQDNAGLYAEETNDGTSLIFFSFEKNNFVKRNLLTSEEKITTDSVTATLLGYNIPRIDTNGEALFAAYRDTNSYHLVQYPFNGAEDNKPKMYLTSHQKQVKSPT